MNTIYKNKRLNVILFCNRPNDGADASTITDHIDSFSRFSSHNIFCFSNTQEYPTNLDLDFFDVLIIHYSSYILNHYYISEEGFKRIRAFKGLKVLFMQDEYRNIYDFHRQILHLGIHVIFTCYPEQSIEIVYPRVVLPLVTKLNTLTGFVPTNLLALEVPTIAERKLDVGYRARKIPFWIGQLGVEKWEIADKFLKHTRDKDITCDISYLEAERIYGENWIKFVSSCKVMLGVESGASVIDFTGIIEKQIREYLLEYPDADFPTISKLFLAEHESRIYMNQISPRCFEAAALRTALVLFEGQYSGILEPERHYIPLKKDFSNIDEVVYKIKNPVLLQEMVDRTYQEIALNPLYTYENFIKNLDKIIEEKFLEYDCSVAKETYTFAEFEIAKRKWPFEIICEDAITAVKFSQNASEYNEPQVEDLEHTAIVIELPEVALKMQKKEKGRIKKLITNKMRSTFASVKKTLHL